MKPDSPFRKAINAIEVWVSVFAMLLLILVVSIQVFCRYVLQDSLAWTEELARYLINGMKTSGKKRDNLGSIGKSFRRGCNSIAESATKKEGNQPSFFVGG